jgi:signal transduction histidine kinase
MADSPQGIGLANMQRRSEVFGRSHTIKTSPGKDCAVVATMQQKPRENVE